jgi:deoxyinosine 3'endonuclease (endonuclease V)
VYLTHLQKQTEKEKKLVNIKPMTAYISFFFFLREFNMLVALVTDRVPNIQRTLKLNNRITLDLTNL